MNEEVLARRVTSVRKVVTTTRLVLKEPLEIGIVCPLNLTVHGVHQGNFVHYLACQRQMAHA